MFLPLLLSSLLFSSVSGRRPIPNKCETCIEVISYALQEFIVQPARTNNLMQALEVYCFHHVGGREAACSDFINLISKGNLLDIIWRATEPCRKQMEKIKAETRLKDLLWACPTTPDCVCLNLQQCEDDKQELIDRSQHVECDDLDTFVLEEFTDIFKKIRYTAYDADIL